jgi:iron complex transport system ATP-binding protein
VRLDLDGVSCSYGGPPVVSAVSLTVGDAGWLGVIGPNGAGKSTLLRAIAGLIPAMGTIRCDGVALPTTRRGVARLVAYVPQRPELPLQMTVADYVLLGRTPHLSYLRSESRGDVAAVAAVLERLSLTHLASRPLGEISGGEAQRAVLARALAQDAPLLLLDEPTTGLDLRHQHVVLELVDELRHERGLTVVASMHDLVLAGQFCDELALLIAGHVVLSGSPDAVLTEENVAHHYGARVRRLAAGRGRAVVVGVRADVTAAAPADRERAP